jgi:hypothetical protein
MKISELLRYRQRLDLVISGGAATEIQHHLDAVLDSSGTHGITEDPHPRLVSGHTQLSQSAQNIQTAFDQFQIKLRNLRDTCDGLISEYHQDYINRSHKLYTRQYSNMKAEDVFARALPLSPEQQQWLISRMNLHCQWTDTALLMRPGQQDWMQYLTSSNLLYVWDHDPSMLIPALAPYPDHQNGRIRVCHGTDRDPFVQLPQAQMALIVAVGFLEFKPLDVMYHYLYEFQRLLRPGGSVVFTFNDCDHAVNTEFAEQNYMCYTPGHLVRERLQELDLEVREHCQHNNGVCWIEAQKPGQHRNIMGATVLTKIHARSK